MLSSALQLKKYEEWVEHDERVTQLWLSGVSVLSLRSTANLSLQGSLGVVNYKLREGTNRFNAVASVVSTILH